MSMRIFIADDEDIIRDGIRRCIEKEGFTFAGEAPDGEMALPMLLEMKPDVLITDVRMPFLDGLELARAVRRALPWTRIVFLSGHNEFEYAQKAVSLRADAYLLKPVDSVRLTHTLREIAGRIEQERQSYLRAADRGEQDILHGYFLNELLSGRVSTATAMEQDWGLSLAARRYIVCQSKIGGTAETLGQVRAVVTRAFEERAEIVWFFRGSRLVLLIKGEDGDEVRERAYEIAQALRHELEAFLGLTVRVGIGTAVDRLGALPESYRRAREAEAAPGSIVGYADLPAEPRFDFTANVSLEEKLRHATAEDVPRLLAAYFGSAEEDDVQSVLYRNYLLMDLLVTAARMPSAGGESAHPPDPQEVLRRAATLEGARECAAETLTALLGSAPQRKNVRYGEEIRRAKRFIQENYADGGLSLHTVAAEVGFSPNHFSTVFSQETGETFVECLTRVRIEAACSALRESDARMGDVAFAVGYHDSHYFSYLFKKIMGMTPSDYRRSAREG